MSSDSKDDLDGVANVVAQSPRTGFETEFYVPDGKISSYGLIAAVDTHGHVLGFTPAVNTSTGELFHIDYNITRVTTSSGIGSGISIEMLGVTFAGMGAVCVALIR